MPGLEDLYREIILDHHRNPRNRGELAPPASHAVGHNPLCGDEISVYLQVEDGIITDVKVGGQGCSISQSSASMMSQAVKGKPVDGLRASITRRAKPPIVGASARPSHHDSPIAAMYRPRSAAGARSATSATSIRRDMPAADEAVYQQRFGKLQEAFKLGVGLEAYEPLEPVPGAKPDRPLPAASPAARTISACRSAA